MNYLIKVTPKYGGREKVYPLIFKNQLDAEVQIIRMRTQFNDYQIIKGEYTF